MDRGYYEYVWTITKIYGPRLLQNYMDHYENIWTEAITKIYGPRLLRKYMDHYENIQTEAITKTEAIMKIYGPPHQLGNRGWSYEKGVEL